MIQKETKEHLDNLLPLLSDEQKMTLQRQIKIVANSVSPAMLTNLSIYEFYFASG
jgi:hypothetical protein